MASVGLYYYRARWFDPRIISFNQPDTLIPDPYNPLDFNRYGYARYNALKFIDPSGHEPDCWDDEYACGSDPNAEYGPMLILDGVPYGWNPLDQNEEDITIASNVATMALPDFSRHRDEVPTT